MAKPRTLRYRMIRLSWIMVASLLAASYLSLFVLLEHEAASELDRRVLAAAQPVREHFQSTSDAGMADLNEFGGTDRYLEVVDLSGHVLERSRDLDQPLGLPRLNWARLQAPVFGDSTDRFGQSLRVVAMPFTHRGHHYVLITALSTFGSHHILDNFGTVVAVMLPLSLLLAGLISAWYVDKSLEPVQTLTRHAELMAERAIHPGGELWQPLPLPLQQDELGRLTATFNRLFHHAEAVMRQLRQFVTDASHEIRTPLAILRGESELLLSGAVAPAGWDKSLHAMDHELRRLTHIVDGLFTLSMADAGQLRLVREPLYLHELLEEACMFVASRAQVKSIQLVRNLNVEVEFHGDEAFLHELFVIFLTNAIKYSPIGTQVRVELTATPEQVEIGFHDQGIGIAADEIEHVFERFYRSLAAGAARESGSGLGLAIAQAIVAAHGGTITCTSTVGVGSSFIISLPHTSSAPAMSGHVPAAGLPAEININ